jgi:hypothetical protein
MIIFQNTTFRRAGFRLRLHVKPTQLGPIDRASPYLWTDGSTYAFVTSFSGHFGRYNVFGGVMYEVEEFVTWIYDYIISVSVCADLLTWCTMTSVSNQGKLKLKPDPILPTPKITLFPAGSVELGWKEDQCVDSGMIKSLRLVGSKHSCLSHTLLSPLLVGQY